MNYLLTIRAHKDDIMDQMPVPWQARIAPLEIQYVVVGRMSGENKIVNAIVNELYVGPNDTRVDENDDLLERSMLPPSWKLLSQHSIERGSDLMKSIAGTPVTVDAVTITDTNIDHSHRYPRYYVRPVIDNAEPENPIITGVILLDRVGDFIEQINGVAPASDGSYTKTWTTPGKDVPGVGTVDPETLETNGDYIHTPYTIELDKPAVVEMTAMDAEYIDFMPDVVDENGENPTRPTQAAEISLFGGYKRIFVP